MLLNVLQSVKLIAIACFNFILLLEWLLTFYSVNYVTSTYQCSAFLLQSNYHRLGKSWCLHRSANIPGHMRIHRIAPVNWNKAANYHAQVQTVGDSGSLFNEERKTLC